MTSEGGWNCITPDQFFQDGYLQQAKTYDSREEAIKVAKEINSYLASNPSAVKELEFLKNECFIPIENNLATIYKRDDARFEVSITNITRKHLSKELQQKFGMTLFIQARPLEDLAKILNFKDKESAPPNHARDY